MWGVGSGPSVFLFSGSSPRGPAVGPWCAESYVVSDYVVSSLSCLSLFSTPKLPDELGHEPALCRLQTELWCASGSVTNLVCKSVIGASLRLRNRLSAISVRRRDCYASSGTVQLDRHRYCPVPVKEDVKVRRERRLEHSCLVIEGRRLSVWAVRH